MEHNLYVRKFAWKILWHMPERINFGSDRTLEEGKERNDRSIFLSETSYVELPMITLLLSC